MDISIIIVNYNVQYFIEQCLNSIFEISHFEGKKEVIVIDNASSDGSISMIKTKFPSVTLIENQDNVGFSVANNQGIAIAKGKYVLLLNPDTIIEEDTLSKCFTEMEKDIKVGAIGVKMVDGAGQFLPESKRGFPSPKISFYRFSGLYKVFPNSPTINGYYQGHIGKDEKAEVDILCGAFMFMRKSVLEDVGTLDEAFFMYGEDIDLSYRIRKAGHKVLYFPGTTIIHFKGESTRKNSIQYTQRFYNAMNIFAKKHFKESKAAVFLKYLSIVISLKAVLNLLKGIGQKLLLPLIDVAVIFLGLQLVTSLWAKYYFQDSSYYDTAPLTTNFLLYTVVWLISIFYGGGYDKKVNVFRLIRNIIIGTIIILAIYGLLDPAYRSSRAIIFLSTIFTLLGVLGIRILSTRFSEQKLEGISDKKNLIIIAEKKESQSIEHSLKQSNSNFGLIQSLPVNISSYELKELIHLNNVDEIICNIRDLGMRRVIELMSSFGDKVAFKITGDESLGIIGSQSKNKSGEIYTIQINYAIQNQDKIRIKRTFDIIIAFLAMFLFPLLIPFKSGRSILRNSLKVIWGDRTLIGYKDHERKEHRLPNLGQAVLLMKESLAMDYARNYTVWKDFRYLWKAFVSNND